MGLFDQMMGGMLGSMLSNAGPAGVTNLIGTLLNGPMAQALPGILNAALAKTPYGSLDGVLAQLQAAGLSEQVASWISTGPNLPVSAEEITAALGQSEIGAAAASLGLSPEALPDLLAQHLPAIIDRFSPEGFLDLPGR